MGLRETPLQNGVILRGRLFAELSSGTGEPSTCRAKADLSLKGRGDTLLHTLEKWSLPRTLEAEEPLPLPFPHCHSQNPPYLAQQQ